MSTMAPMETTKSRKTNKSKLNMANPLPLSDNIRDSSSYDSESRRDRHRRPHDPYLDSGLRSLHHVEG